jgi:hypothetical protein
MKIKIISITFSLEFEEADENENENEIPIIFLTQNILHINGKMRDECLLRERVLLLMLNAKK